VEGAVAVLLPKATWEGIADGSITVAFRRWRRPSVTAGGTLRAAPGVLAIDAVEPIGEDEITDADARAAGAADADAVRADLADREGRLYRIRFHLAGEDPRLALGEDVPSGEALAAAVAEVDAIDARSRRGPWTQEVLELIAANPGVVAADLAARSGRERLPFKADVRRLKELGLTRSLAVGYRLSPRGEAVTAARR
jgi:hypothetical protein